MHEECLEWVLHCYVKPQNILLDSEYQPKTVTAKSAAIGSDGLQTSGEIEHKRLVTLVRDKKNRAKGVTSWIEEIIEPTLEGKYDQAKMEALVSLALQCVEEDKDARPTMSDAFAS
ncbi:hypothetical protein GH714_004966 [Hevea brasiliensis]|uniref:Protein kinase domain-containing protein n=1 Tax=Hevea brasiliensis TaxID=3981 RepID=A0A6A6MC12_HEVBR|nr:hypothetical protein GH714_004966 [Hevea brasiliensis]